MYHQKLPFVVLEYVHMNHIHSLSKHICVYISTNQPRWVVIRSINGTQALEYDFILHVADDTAEYPIHCYGVDAITALGVTPEDFIRNASVQMFIVKAMQWFIEQKFYFWMKLSSYKVMSGELMQKFGKQLDGVEL